MKTRQPNGFHHNDDLKPVLRRRSSGRVENNSNGKQSMQRCNGSTSSANHKNTPEDDIPTRPQILKDPANLCTFAGAILATFALACMWHGRYYSGMCLNMIANMADILDGPIARSTTNRHPAFALVGCKMDCYSDLVSHFVVPASLLMHLSGTHPLCTALAALYICTGILRQSYFEVSGRCDGGSCIYGTTSDYMVAIYAITMHLFPLVGSDYMPAILSASFIAMIFLSLTFSLRSRRYEGFGLFTVTSYNVLLCVSCLVLAVFHNSDNISLISGSLLAANLVLAYPCYFRFVELNV